MPPSVVRKQNIQTTGAEHYAAEHRKHCARYETKVVTAHQKRVKSSTHAVAAAVADAPVAVLPSPLNNERPVVVPGVGADGRKMERSGTPARARASASSSAWRASSSGSENTTGTRSLTMPYFCLISYFPARIGQTGRSEIQMNGGRYESEVWNV